MRALVIGATGLVGGHITRLLLDSPDVSEVAVFVRRSTGIGHAKLEEHTVDFADAASWKEHLRGDVLFSALGTTRRQAGSVEAQRQIDYGLQLQVARDAVHNGVRRLVLISSPYADPESKMAYPRLKGELERDVLALPFEAVSILQPGPLMGRKKSRGAEGAVQLLAKMASIIPKGSRFRAIDGFDVAQAAVAIDAAHPSGTHRVRLGEVHEWAASPS